MSDQDKTLQETLAEAIGGNNDTASSSANETEQGISGKGAADETKSGETPEYASGIDISDIPEQDRPRIKELLSKKAKLIEDGYVSKFQKVAQLDKIQKDLEKLGVTTEEAGDVLMKHIESKRNPPTSTEKKDALKTLDKLLSEAPYEQRSALEQMRKIIQEETGVSELKDKVDKMEKLLGIYQQSAMEQREKQVTTELTAFTEKYGKELVDKYADVIKEKAVQHPNLSIAQIFRYEVPDEEKEQAILLKGKKPLTEDKKKAITNTSSGVTSATEKVDVKKSSYADILLKGLGK